MGCYQLRLTRMCVHVLVQFEASLQAFCEAVEEEEEEGGKANSVPFLGRITLHRFAQRSVINRLQVPRCGAVQYRHSNRSTAVLTPLLFNHHARLCTC